MTSTIRDMTFKGEPTQAIRKVARKQGMHTLFEDGMIKALKGQTTLEEVLRITHQESLAETTGLSRLEWAASRDGSRRVLDRPDGPDPGRRTLRARCPSRVGRHADVEGQQITSASLDRSGVHRNNGLRDGPSVVDATPHRTISVSLDTWSTRQNQPRPRGGGPLNGGSDRRRPRERLRDAHGNVADRQAAPDGRDPEGQRPAPDRRLQADAPAGRPHGPAEHQGAGERPTPRR